MVVFRVRRLGSANGAPPSARYRWQSTNEPSGLRAPAMISPRAFRTSPTALTTTRAPTMTSPLPERVADAPKPAGIILSRPAALPQVAPAPAPILPSATSSFACSHARYASSGPGQPTGLPALPRSKMTAAGTIGRSEEHTSELQSLAYLVCRLLLEKKKKE